MAVDCRAISSRKPRFPARGNRCVAWKDGAMEAESWDNGGRRCGLDRRQFSYSGHVPERRSGEERRSGNDRRQEPRLGPENRAGTGFE